ncbi:tetratricopeptide repeat protein [Shewanella frigidimarina]|uniref:tetratricopeptide repeat protein n=1 Tax=Shewanella frigidimarina TaxID=56812 RepID=UPI00317A8D88|tara:strand:- start:5443 stop:5877 length:435 start_codon:yes stop_codon:yes gene_type:complete
MKILSKILVVFLISGCANSKNVDSSTLVDMLTTANEAYHDARLNDAETQYLNITKNYPDYKEAWFKLGNIYARQGRLKASIRQYERVIQLDSEDGRAWYNLAIVKVNESKKILTEAGRVLPENSEFILPINALKAQLNTLSKGR